MDKKINDLCNKNMQLGFELLNYIEKINYMRVYKKDIKTLWNLANKIYNTNTEIKAHNMEERQ